MNSLEQQIRNCIAEYPTLFESRTDVLRHMFTVLGCGFYWVNGELESITEWSEYKELKDSQEIERRANLKVKIKNKDTYPYYHRCILGEMPENVTIEYKNAGYEILKALPFRYKFKNRKQLRNTYLFKNHSFLFYIKTILF